MTYIDAYGDPNGSSILGATQRRQVGLMVSRLSAGIELYAFMSRQYFGSDPQKIFEQLKGNHGEGLRGRRAWLKRADQVPCA